MVKNTCSSCGNALEAHRIEKYSYCNSCHAKWMRENRKIYSELAGSQKQKNCARSYVNVYVRRGILIKQSCEICGNENAEKHHDDYSKPLQVRWFCRSCHLNFHKQKAYSTN